ncbi:hypothetical protein [Lysobacter sp. yr284]|uniref:hypothetical protein n=1 Tax=Lysobacter sp. yr284 TaxID=1761791 RepID=UPI0011140BA9|nr:hypothetical protein [Lysobacter sp. yr284]
MIAQPRAALNPLLAEAAPRAGQAGRCGKPGGAHSASTVIAFFRIRAGARGPAWAICGADH